LKSLPAKSSALPTILTLTIALLASGCGGSSGSGSSTSTTTPSTANEWTWESGSDTAKVVGVYGTQGTASTSNVPAARGNSVSWTDGSGNLWLFGGGAWPSPGQLNDLWEYSPTAKTWTWVSGSSTVDAIGVYGTLGVAAASNVPGARSNPVGWTDTSGNLWLFGGEGYDANGKIGGLNDLWEFNTSTKGWAWIAGADAVNAKGTYGTLGTASITNIPGARSNPVSWTDTSGNFWLFGGEGYDSAGANGLLNDLWEFIPSAKTWTWIGGSNTANASGVYGTLGIAAASNVPGGRTGAVSWTDGSGNFWLFGGEGYGPAGMYGFDLSDLWEFNPTTKQWTWVSGSTAGGVAPVYGTQGVASASNIPGGRDSAVGWADSSGNLWLFGGFDYDSTTGANGTNQYLNDLWEFSAATKQWTWVGGSNTGGAKGVYGTLGTPSASNVPGARGSQGIAVTWKDSSGNFWLFGGVGYDSTGAQGDLNDLWRYQP